MVPEERALARALIPGIHFPQNKYYGLPYRKYHRQRMNYVFFGLISCLLAAAAAARGILLPPSVGVHVINLIAACVSRQIVAALARNSSLPSYLRWFNLLA